MHYSKMCYNVSNGGALVYQRMVQSLESYVAQATQAYQPAQTAVQNQINALSGQLDATNEQINRNYAQQQAGLNRQKNMAAETASMQAAGSGGSFGGAANLANRKYYDQTFVPAVTQLRTGQTNELAAARQANEDQRTALNSQLANLQAQANQEALQQYWNAQEAEAQRQAQLRAQREANAAQNAYYKYLMNAMKGNNSGYTLASNKNLYGGYDWTDAQGNKHRAGTVAAAAGGDFNEALWGVLNLAGNQGDYYSSEVAKQLQNGARFAKNTGGSTGNAMYDTLGIRRIN